MPRSASVGGLAKRGVIPRKQFYIKLFFYNTVILVSRDVGSMPGHFAEFIQVQESPGLLLVHSRRPIGSVIEGLLLVWMTWTEEDLRNRSRELPYQVFGIPRMLPQ